LNIIKISRVSIILNRITKKKLSLTVAFVTLILTRINKTNRQSLAQDAMENLARKLLFTTYCRATKEAPVKSNKKKFRLQLEMKVHIALKK
jgi:hypothetical protein